MTFLSLLASTGSPSIDTLLANVLAIGELVFPDRIRAAYLTGSTIDGTAAFIPDDPLNSSDIDLMVVFKGDMSAHEQQRFLQYRTACAGLAHLHVDQLDAAPVAETHLMEHGHLTLKVASRHLAGEDIRPAIPFPTLPDHIDTAIRISKDHIAELRHLTPTQLVIPVSYPDSNGMFYGYDYAEAAYGDQPGTRLLVGSITWAATALIALQTGQLVASKRDAIHCYKTAINDSWSGLVEAVYTNCKLRWGYRIPRTDHDRQQFRHMCMQIVEFENMCLMRYAADEPLRKGIV